MTIFDSKPLQIGPTLKSAFCEVNNWKYPKLDGYTNKNEISCKIRMKKKVTFADDNGQELISVLIFDNSIFPDLRYCSHHNTGEERVNDRNLINVQPYDWVTSFIQPASVYNRFKSELIKQKVKLATVVISKHSLSVDNYWEYQMTGIIKLVNLCFEKRVFIRLSSDSKWTSFTDFEAKYKNSCSEFLTDKSGVCDVDEFEFQIFLPIIELHMPTYLEFAVAMETNTFGVFWDNNNEKNYRIDYCQISLDKLSNGYSSYNPYTNDCKPNMELFRGAFTYYRAWNHFSEEFNFY